MDKINAEFVKNFLIKKKFIFPTNQHDNSQAGFQSYGPIGLKIKNGIINMWRKTFISSNIYEIESPVLLGKPLLTRSGHITKFNDLGIIFYDKSTNKVNSIKRADHFIKEKIKELNLNIIYKEDENFINNFLESNNVYNINEEYIEIKSISLMFKLDNIDEELYLRPELAQTMFIEFKHFYEYNNSKLPFGIAQVGKSFRNEISSKLFVRLKEFQQAEVEYFHNPHDSFEFVIPDDYKNKDCYILSSDMQDNNLNEKKILLSNLDEYTKNPLLRMFIFKLYVFVENIGLNMNKLRFREHNKDEMAHYSKGCWDLECDIFGKWLELAGVTDRSDYDLKNHDKNDLFKIRKNDISTEKYKLIPNKKKIFKNLDAKSGEEFIENNTMLIIDSKEELDKMDLNFFIVTKYNHYDFIVPSVIEPSVGIDRVFYALICNNLFLRNDNVRPYLILSKHCQTYDFMLAQLSNHTDLLKKFNELKSKFTNHNIFTDLSSTTIGKRYTRADELGIKYSITIDFDTLVDNTVTVRSIDDMSQVRINIDEVVKYW
jgi:glycyl-tRNA synthetase